MKKKPKKNPAAQAMAELRHKKLTPERRKQIASDAAKERWSKPQA
jgi:hypothetical protein